MLAAASLRSIVALMRVRRTLPLVLAPVLVAGLLSLAPPSAATDTCRTSAPSSGSYTVTVCFTTPSPGDMLTGTVRVSATVTVSGDRVVRTLQFFVDTGFVLTDFEAPYAFDLPTERWPEGSHRLKVEATIKGNPDWVSQRALLDVVFDNPGGSPATTPFAARTPSPSTGHPLVVAAVADGASGRSMSKKVTDLIASWNPDLLLYAGDVYEEGTPTEFLNWYGRNGSRWSRFRSITNPAVGNHEYRTPGAAGYFDYWGNPPHHYSYDAGGWHFISLDSTFEYGQTASGTPQYEWLRNDLLDNPSSCTIAYFHHPPFSLGDKVVSDRLMPIWSLLAKKGVDIVVTGHEHNYIRWKPMDANGHVDPNGATAFVVGTGGHFMYPQLQTDPRVAKRYAWKYGALRLGLSDGEATFTFVGSDDSELDGGTLVC